MEKIALAELQRRFLSALDADSLDVSSSDLGARDTPPISFATRFGVYHTAVRLRFAESLAQDFPGLESVLGAQKFTALTKEYLRKYPARSPGLAELGKFLPEFLASAAATSWSEWPFLSDLATYHWKLILAAWARDIPPMDLEKMQGLAAQDPDRLILEFHPSVSLFESPWQVDRIGTPEPLGVRDRVYLQIYRRETHSYCRRVSGKVFAFAKALLSGETLGSLGPHLKRIRLGEEKAIGLVSSWVQEGLIVGFRLEAAIDGRPSRPRTDQRDQHSEV